MSNPEQVMPIGRRLALGVSGHFLQMVGGYLLFCGWDYCIMPGEDSDLLWRLFGDRLFLVALAGAACIPLGLGLIVFGRALFGRSMPVRRRPGKGYVLFCRNIRVDQDGTQIHDQFRQAFYCIREERIQRALRPVADVVAINGPHDIQGRVGQRVESDREQWKQVFNNHLARAEAVLVVIERVTDSMLFEVTRALEARCEVWLQLLPKARMDARLAELSQAAGAELSGEPEFLVLRWGQPAQRYPARSGCLAVSDSMGYFTYFEPIYRQRRIPRGTLLAARLHSAWWSFLYILPPLYGGHLYLLSGSLS